MPRRAGDGWQFENRRRPDIVAGDEGRRRLDIVAFSGLLNEHVLKGCSTQSVAETNTGPVGYSDTLWQREKCHCKQLSL